MKTGRPKKGSSYRTLSELGITRNQSSQWQKLAEIPKEQFEEEMARPGKPNTSAIIRRYYGQVGEVLTAGQLETESQMQELVALLRKLGPKAVREVWLAVKKMADG